MNNEKLLDMGRPYKFTPEQFQRAWEEYFDHCDNNPWIKNEAIKSGEMAGTLVQIPTARPYSEIGFCAYHNLNIKYLAELAETLRNKEEKTDDEEALSYILARARAKCYNQKFEGAAVGAFNANIIARVLGLTDKTEIDHLSGGKPMQTISLGSGINPDAEDEKKEG